jgi:Zn-dependent oligopeptidase
MSTEFSNKQQNYWLKSENAQKILLAGVTKLSLEYQGQLEKEIKFNDSAIQVMKKKLEQLMDSSNNKVERIATPSPQFTAVKVISALQILMQELKQDENYLVVPSSLLQDEEEM